MIFKDLPDKTTPINAENLNKNATAISPVQPVNGEELWMQKGKNLLKVIENRKNITQAYYYLVKGKISTVEGETYTISFDTNNNGGRVYSHEGIFTYGVANCDGTRKSFTVTAKHTGTFSANTILVPNLAVSTAYDLSNIQIEQGSIATEYEAYVEETLNVKNNNGIYEEFLNVEKVNNQQNYSTEEQVIGTWIDGKPLYRKVVDFGALPNNASKLVSLGINNLKEITKADAIVKNENQYIPLPYLSSDTYKIVFYIESGSASISTGTDRSGATAHVTVEYIKTTD